MSYTNFANNELQCKVVYYGPERSGKTANLKFISSHIRNKVNRSLPSIDRRMDLDFFPLDLGRVGDFIVRLQLYSVPGRLDHNVTQNLVLEGVDGVVFVADSLRLRQRNNIESIRRLAEDLQQNGIKIQDVPLVIQYNKRDLQDGFFACLPIDMLQRDLNTELHAPFFLASAVRGYGVLETLRAISKLVAGNVALKAIEALRTTSKQKMARI